jgi:cytochrome c oxidase subunit III
VATVTGTTTRAGFGSGGNGGPPGSGDGGGGGRQALPAPAYRMGMALGLISIAMLFVALTSAYVVRQGLDPDWRAIPMPPILWTNTVVLAVSSLTVEIARRARKPAPWLSGTLGLGLAFLVGQFAAWRQLSSSGIYLSTNPHSSFFYLLTGLHLVHLTAGLAALSYLVGRSLASGRSRASGVRTLDAAALYWHFMDALWVYLFLLLFAWR